MYVENSPNVQNRKVRNQHTMCSKTIEQQTFTGNSPQRKKIPPKFAVSCCKDFIVKRKKIFTNMSTVLKMTWMAIALV